MARLTLGLCCCFAAKVICAQQALPAIQNVANVSSFSQILAPGVIFFVNASYGASLTDGSTAAAAGTPLPTRLAGARVLLLLLEQLALARDVPAVALGGDVLAHGLDRLARDHPA